MTVISIIRLPLLLKLDLNSKDLDYNFINFGSWSIAESNMAIVAGIYSHLVPQKAEAKESHSMSAVSPPHFIPHTLRRAKLLSSGI